MKSNNFKNIVGEIKTGEVATIRFFGKITEDSTTLFNNEFDFLENAIRPSLIRVLINSEGGSVLHGMSTYSTIQNSTVPTECIIEGMAASMGSIIWAAGARSFMRDYSILMIHNPFLPSNEEAQTSDLVQAFVKQIKTIYRKRFGMTKERVEAIMDGDTGKDGTFFDAKAAIKAGIIPTENILHTSKQLCEKVKNELTDLENISEIQVLMSRICMEADALDIENKHFESTFPNLNQIQNNHTKMDELKTNSAEYAAVAASLGMKEKYEVKDVMSRISELLGVEDKLAETGKSLKDAQTVIAGKEATIQNLQKDKDTLTASLTVFQTKEADEKKAKIEALVEAAIDNGKIDKTSKAQWVEMAESNYPLAENILSCIPVREQITKEIAADPANIQAARQTTEEKMDEKVQAVVGAKFEFKTLG
ncbi:Clp protease ClpP [Dysgonomonas sp. GY617]|uniref:Clp protease ClpP n=1 Tax=Dysgonomonas sp. GY617 TaxID=2780420 RepID=UPI0018841D80|nr:Clp protease ClpP [Dysgonomonas sp. GY617]MBF0577392.1 Clp protease ClpP [Dysgonomonas sp. GY617]